MGGLLPSGLYAGVARSVVEGWRAEVMTALQNLAAGKQVQTASYAQGASGSQSVTYVAPTVEGLRARLIELNTALGYSGRRAIGLRF